MARVRVLIANQDFFRHGEQGKGYNVKQGEEIPEDHELYPQADLMVYRNQAHWETVDRRTEK